MTYIFGNRHSISSFFLLIHRKLPQNSIINSQPKQCIIHISIRFVSLLLHDCVESGKHHGPRCAAFIHSEVDEIFVASRRKAIVPTFSTLSYTLCPMITTDVHIYLLSMLSFCNETDFIWCKMTWSNHGRNFNFCGSAGRAQLITFCRTIKTPQQLSLGEDIPFFILQLSSKICG